MVIVDDDIDGESRERLNLGHEGTDVEIAPPLVNPGQQVDVRAEVVGAARDGTEHADVVGCRGACRCQ